MKICDGISVAIVVYYLVTFICILISLFLIFPGFGPVHGLKQNINYQGTTTFSKKYLFIWLHWVLVAAHRI